MTVGAAVSCRPDRLRVGLCRRNRKSFRLKYLLFHSPVEHVDADTNIQTLFSQDSISTLDSHVTPAYGDPRNGRHGGRATETPAIAQRSQVLLEFVCHKGLRKIPLPHDISKCQGPKFHSKFAALNQDIPQKLIHLHAQTNSFAAV